MASQRTANARSTNAKTSSSLTEGVCDMCYHETKEWAVGQCDHFSCIRCSTKLRLLCGQKECPVCRLNLKKVLLVHVVKPYASFVGVHRWSCDRKNGVFFQNPSLQDAYYSLMENKCSKCSEPPFRSFKLLRDHMIRAHDLHYCDICVDNLKLFPSEFKTYTRRELALHRREGDKDDSSHKGHPLCHFCDERFLDNDHLHSHLRKSHFWCHFCESDGKQDYFCDYPLLRRHFKQEHFLCVEGPCKNEKFTSVFRSKLDLQAHKASAHSKGLSKAEAKQLRQLDVGFLYSRERDEEEAVPVRRHRYTAVGGGDYGDKGSRNGPGRNRAPPDKSRPKPKKSSSPTPLPVKTSLVEETRAPPPGFLTQAAQPSPTGTSLTLHSTGEGSNWSSFDPYVDMANTSGTLHPVVGGKPVADFQQPRPELLTATTNPPPGFRFPRLEENKDTETEWPDLTNFTDRAAPGVGVFPLGGLQQPVMGNITAAVMNVNQNRKLNLLSESSFPSLAPAPTTTVLSSDQTWPVVSETVDPPHSERSKLLKFAVAATNNSSTSSYSGPLTTRPFPTSIESVRTKTNFLNLSSENFPPMASTPLVSEGNEMLKGGGNQNDFKTKSASDTTAKRSKQSQLIEMVRKSLDYDRDKFTRFKTLTGWYKNCEISLDEYQAQCLVLFGSSQWREIGPELAEMMPNPQKKNELLSSFGIHAGGGKSKVVTTASTKSRKRVPAKVSSVWGAECVTSSAPVSHNFNAMSTGLSHEEYPTLGSAMFQPKPLPQPTPWNVLIQ